MKKKEMKYEIVGSSLMTDGLVVMTIEPSEIAISPYWLKRAGFRGELIVHKGEFSSGTAYSTKISSKTDRG